MPTSLRERRANKKNPQSQLYGAWKSHTKKSTKSTEVLFPQYCGFNPSYCFACHYFSEISQERPITCSELIVSNKVQNLTFTMMPEKTNTRIRWKEEGFRIPKLYNKRCVLPLSLPSENLVCMRWSVPVLFVAAEEREWTQDFSFHCSETKTWLHNYRQPPELDSSARNCLNKQQSSRDLW